MSHVSGSFLPRRQSSHPACHRPDECRDMFGDRCGPWRVPSNLCGPVSQGSAVSNNIDLRTLKVKYSANPTAHPYGKTLRRNSGEIRRRRKKPTATKKPLRLTSGCPTQPKLSCVWPDRKSTRLNSSHRCISYAVFC